MAAKLPPTLPRLPDPAGLDMADGEAVREYLTLFTSAVTKHLAQRPTTTQPVAEQLLYSPNGTVYKLTVSDSGAATVAPLGSVEGKPLPP